MKLREIEPLCNQGNTIAEAARQAGITEQTYYRWRKEYGGMNTADAKRVKELEKENARLKILPIITHLNKGCHGTKLRETFAHGTAIRPQAAFGVRGYALASGVCHTNAMLARVYGVEAVDSEGRG